MKKTSFLNGSNFLQNIFYISDKQLNLIHKKVDFVTPVEMSYKCDKQQKLDLYPLNGNTSVGALKISKFQFQAYGDIINKHFADG